MAGEWRSRRVAADRLRPGHYLQVAASRYPQHQARPGEAFARVERVEHITAHAASHPVGTAASAWGSRVGDVQVAVFCYGIPGPVLLRAGDHRVLAEIDRARREHDERSPWWELGPRPVFAGAVIAGGAPVRTNAREPGTDGGPPGTRRGARFGKPARVVRPGDYLEVVADRFPGHDRGSDEGFHRVEWIGYLDVPVAGRLLADRAWAAVPGPVVVTVSGVPGLLVLPGRDVGVLVMPNPEREAFDRLDRWFTSPPVTIAGVREPSAAERGEADRTDARLRPPPPSDEADLYPQFVTDPHERAMLFHGVEGIRVVPLSVLPWPHNLSECAYAGRVGGIARTYPDVGGADQVAHAELFTRLTPADMAACPYHQADWAAIAAAAVQLAGEDSLETARDRAESWPGMSEGDRRGLVSLFWEPVSWDDGDDGLTNGQHRLCALRAAGAAACPVEGRYLPGSGPVIQADLGAREHARRTVTRFWTEYLATGVPVGVAALAGGLLARRPRLRRFLPGRRLYW
jgi:hypothetical protein